MTRLGHPGDRVMVPAAELYAIGYDGKLCVHPDQVPLANDAYTPSGEQVGQARQLLAGLES